MLTRLRVAFGLLLVLAGVVLGAAGAFAQDEGGDGKPPAAAPDASAGGPSSPQELFDRFFKAYNDGRLQEMVRYLDLPAERREEGDRLARLLVEVLNYHGRVDTKEIPDATGIGARTTWTLETLQGPVKAALAEGRWLFSRETLDAVPKMHAAFVASGDEMYRAFTLRRFVPEALRGRALFLEHWQWIGLVLLALLAWLVHRVVAFFSGKVMEWVLRARGWEEASTKAADDASRPVGLLAVAAVIHFLTPYLRLPDAPVNFEFFSGVASKFFASLAAVLVCYRLADVAGAKLQEAASRTDSKLDDQLVPLVRRSIKILVTAGGILFILDNLDVKVWSLVTGLGVAGVGFAFAAKDTLANLIGSITVFLDKPFQVGDWINVSGIDGTVEEVGFRSTRLRTFYNSQVSIPNAKLVDSPVDNYGRRQYRRFYTTIGIQYDTPAEVIEAYCAGLREIVRANPRMRQDMFHLYLNDFGPSSLNIIVYVFFRVEDWAAELRERQNFMLEAIRLARELGVEFAFPTTTLHLASTPERPPRPAADRPVDELDAVVRRFAKGGESSRPSGTERWSAARGEGGS